MKTKSVTLAELKKGNARMCLSAKRALKLCWQCKLYLLCESKIVNAAFDADMQKVGELITRIEAIKSKWPKK